MMDSKEYKQQIQQMQVEGLALKTRLDQLERIEQAAKSLVSITTSIEGVKSSVLVSARWMEVLKEALE